MKDHNPTQAEEFRRMASQARRAAIIAEQHANLELSQRYRAEALAFENRAKHAEDIASLSKLGEVQA